jgi:hypothetical protein
MQSIGMQLLGSLRFAAANDRRHGSEWFTWWNRRALLLICSRTTSLLKTEPVITARLFHLLSCIPECARQPHTGGPESRAPPPEDAPQRPCEPAVAAN